MVDPAIMPPALPAPLADSRASPAKPQGSPRLGFPISVPAHIQIRKWESPPKLIVRALALGIWVKWSPVSKHPQPFL